MQDSLGWRRLFGVLGPSTNTTVQPDFDDMRPPGVTNHYSRIYTPNAKAISDETFYAATQVIGQNVLDAVRSVMTCEPHYLVMGMSAVTFYGGRKGADDFIKKVETESGIKISVGSHSCTEALRAYGGVKRIAFFSPYYPVANTAVRQYFTEMGFEVKGDVPLHKILFTPSIERLASALNAAGQSGSHGLSQALAQRNRVGRLDSEYDDLARHWNAQPPCEREHVGKGESVGVERAVPFDVGQRKPPYAAVLANALVTLELFLLTRNLAALLVCVPLHGLAWLVCLAEPRCFELLAAWA